MTTNSELLPCPFCGEAAKFCKDDDGWNWIECCGCRVATNRRVSAMDDCRPLLAEAWNTRQPAMPADAMTAVADRYAHRMAMHLECILLDYSGKWADEAMQTLCDYRDAMNAIHEAESPTYMGEPVIARRRIEGES